MTRNATYDTHKRNIYWEKDLKNFINYRGRWKRTNWYCYCKKKNIKARLFQARSMDPTPFPHPSLAWYIYIYISKYIYFSFLYMGKCPTFMSTRTTVKRELPKPVSIAFFSVLVRVTTSSQDAILFSLCSSDNHLSRKHLFTTLLSLPVWGTGQMWNWIVMTVSDFYFYFEILYWIMYILNNAIILPVCNICVEISL